jgi:ABC-type polysaccharide/polyol phosphate export permease
MKSGFSDIVRTFSMPRLILYMAWSDVRARYKRSVLGPLWITISTAIGVVGLGFIWSELFKMERAVFIPMLTIGLVLWQWLSACIVESTSIFYRQAGIIRNLDLPLSLHPAQLILRHIINLAHNIPLVVIVFVILGRSLNASAWMVIGGLALDVVNLYWMSLCLGMLGARFRDLEYLVSTVMPLLMFLSPVMYRPNALPQIGRYMWLNPLADMIEIIRYPLLGEITPPFVYMVNLGILIVGGSLTLALFNAKHKRIAFWV